MEVVRQDINVEAAEPLHIRLMEIILQKILIAGKNKFESKRSDFLLAAVLQAKIAVCRRYKK